MTNIIEMGSDLDRLARKLEFDARVFFANKQDDNSIRSRRWVVFDLEFLFDRRRHEGYAGAEGREAKEEKIRWPFHQVAAACWMTLELLPGHPVPIVEGPVVMTADDSGERPIVEALCAQLEDNPDAVVTTWGGEVRDLAVLRRAAATHGLLLPHQLIDGSPNARERLDLCRATCVQADSVHLPELAAAVGVPAKPTPSQQIGKRCEAGDWSVVREQVLADVLTTAVLAVRHLAAHREIECRQPDTFMAIADAAVAAIPDSEFARLTFASWARGQKAASRLRGKVYRAAA